MEKRAKETISKVGEHRFSLTERKILKMHGIVEVTSFDERIMTLETLMGPLVIKGKDLLIQSVDLETGFLQLEGYFQGLEYVSPGKTKGFLARLLK